MSIVARLLGLGAGYGRQAISRVLPASEERVLAQLRMRGPEMLQKAAQKDTGFTFDPRRGKFLEPGKQSGSMMASVPNLPGMSSGAGTVRTVDELIEAASKPEVMSRLRRGEYLGGWNPEGAGVGLDPSKRFLTEYGALRSGMKTDQMGGFSLLRSRGYDVNPAELSKARTKFMAGTGLAGLGATAAAATTEQGREFLGGLVKGTRETESGAESAGRVVRSGFLQGALPVDKVAAPLLGIMAIPKLNKLSKLGVAVGSEGRDAAVVARNRAKSLGVPEEDLATILDTDGEEIAFAKSYAITRKHAGQMFNKRSKEDLEIERAKVVGNQSVIDASPSQELLDNVMTTIPVNVKAADTTRAAALTSSKVTPELAQVGARPVRNASKAEDLATLHKAGKTQELSDAITDMQSNLLRYVTQEDLDSIAARNGAPVFYILHSLATRARAAALGIPLTRFLASQGPASAKAGPIPEVVRGIAALFQGPIRNRNLASARKALSTDKAKLSAEDLAANTASNKLRDKEIKQGSLINLVEPGQLQGDIASPARALAEVEDDILKFIKDPTSVSGIAAKVYSYLGTTASPLQKVSAVMDSWMQRAAFGNVNLSTVTPNNTLAYQLVHESFVDLARQLNVPPAALQEVIWKNIRFVARENSDAFADLWDDAFLRPFVSKGAKLQPGTPTVLDMAPEIKAQNEAFSDKLIAAVEKDPELAKYIEIVGQDVQFSDEFFKLINLFP